MTEERIAQLEALCHAATEGPWHYESAFGSIVRTGEDEFLAELMPFIPDADGEVMAEGRTALPEALAEVRRLQSVVHAAKEEIRRGAHTTETGAIRFGATETVNAYRLLMDSDAVPKEVSRD